jgi:hypothetical protein
MLAADNDFAAIGMIQPTDQIQDGGLARTRWAHQRDKLAHRNFQVQAMQDFDGFFAAPVILDHIAQGYGGGHAGLPCCDPRPGFRPDLICHTM